MIRTWLVLLGLSVRAGYAALGPNLYADGDMEAATVAAWPVAGEVRTHEKSRAQVHSGAQSLHVVTGDSSWGGVRKIITGLEPDATYRLWYFARTVGGDARLDVSVGDGKQWASVFGGHRLAGPKIWWPGGAYIQLRDPSRTAASPTGRLTKASQIRVQFRKAGGGAAEFYLDDVELRLVADDPSGELLRDGGFEQDPDTPSAWALTGAAQRHTALCAAGRACLRLGPGAEAEQTVQLSPRTAYTVRYEWSTAGRARVAVGVSYDTPAGRQYLDLGGGPGGPEPRYAAPYCHRGFKKGFGRVGVAFRTPDHSGPYVVTFINRGRDAADLDSVSLARRKAASVPWMPFEVTYDGDGSHTGKPLRDLMGFLGAGPCSDDDLRGQRTAIDRDGFIRVGPKGHFVNGKGERVRFYAVNMPGLFAMPKTVKAARCIASRLAKLGVNLVRIHGLDYKQKSWGAQDRPGLFGPASWRAGTTELYPEAARRLDLFIAQCKAHRVYVQLDLMTSRTFAPADGVPDLDALLRVTPWHKTRLFVSSYEPRMLALQKRFQTQLLTHLNPHTGLRLADDPVVASVELKNEEGLLYCGFTRGMYEGYPARYQELLAGLWSQWLQSEYADSDQLRAAWAEKGRTGLGRPERLGAVAFAPEARDIGPYSRGRHRDMIRFLTQLVVKYQDGMVAHLRSLGVKCPIRDTQALPRPCQMRVQSRLDYVDAHSYWGAPLDQAMVRSTGGNLVSPGFLAVEGKPMSVSEYNAPSGQVYRAEMPILFAAYAALQDWDSITLHSYGGAAGRIDATALQFHYIASYGDTALIPQFPVAAKIFREGLVGPARRAVHIRYTREECDRGGSVSARVAPETVLIHRVRTTGFDAEGPLQTRAPATPKSPYVSDTGELAWDAAAGLVTVQSPQVEAAVGFLGGRTVKLRYMALRSETEFAAISLVARDGQPLRSCGSMLLTAVARAENTGAVWDQGHTRVLGYGRAPVLAEPVAAEVELRTREPVRVFALDCTGKRSGAIEVERAEDSVRLRLDPSAGTVWYEIVRTPE